MNYPTKLNRSGMQLKPEQLKAFFIGHLNRIYCAKSHLLERLPELAGQADFKDLKYAIIETWEDVGRQLARLEQIYTLLDERPDLKNCDDLIDFIEDGFNSIYRHDEKQKLRDLSILFYLSLVESVETVSFQILQMAAGKLPNKHIKQLLRENFDESKADQILFLQITEKYI